MAPRTKKPPADPIADALAAVLEPEKAAAVAEAQRAVRDAKNEVKYAQLAFHHGGGDPALMPRVEAAAVRNRRALSRQAAARTAIRDAATAALVPISQRLGEIADELRRISSGMNACNEHLLAQTLSHDPLYLRWSDLAALAKATTALSAHLGGRR